MASKLLIYSLVLALASEDCSGSASSRDSSGTPDARSRLSNDTALLSHISLSLSLGLDVRAFAPG